MTQRTAVIAALLSLLGIACGGSDEPAARSGDSTESGSGGEEGLGHVTVEREDQGQMVVLDQNGRIGFQTNVRMELETLPGTSGTAAQQFGMVVQARMAQIRSCYDRAVASDPEIQGVLKLVLETDRASRVHSDVAEAGLARGHITECVLRLLRQLPRSDLPEDSKIWVVLTASNTMAEGTRQVREYRERQDGGAAPAP